MVWKIFLGSYYWFGHLRSSPLQPDFTRFYEKNNFKIGVDVAQIFMMIFLKSSYMRVISSIAAMVASMVAYKNDPS